MLYELNFQGYWRIGQTGVAEYPGIYCVYDSSPEHVTDIIYIGRTSSAIVESGSDIERLEAAMVYRHKPSCNDQLKHHFYYPETEVITSGKITSSALTSRYRVVLTLGDISLLKACLTFRIRSPIIYIDVNLIEGSRESKNGTF